MCQKKVKLLIFAHYYAPDVASTGQILQDLAEGLADTFEVTVICTVPSYTGLIDEYYKKKEFYFEELNGVKIIRVSVPEFTKKSKISRIRNLIAYFIRAKRAIKYVGAQDVVMAVSQPPIIGGILGAFSKNKLHNDIGDRPKFIYQIQDFNPEQIEAVGYFKYKLLLDVLKSIDKKTCKSADLVITVGRDLINTLKNRFNNTDVPKYAMINNWIDDQVIYPLNDDNIYITAFKNKYDLMNKFVIMYSGNIGLYYDLEGIFEVINRKKDLKTVDGREVVFAFVGEGSILDKLKKYKAEHNLYNAVFIPYQKKEDLLYSLNAADVHLCVNAKGIKGVSCPSKFYGIIAAKKPVLGVLEKGAEVELLIKDIGCGLCSEPGDYKMFEKNLKWFIDNVNSDELYKMGKNGYEYLKKNLTKEKSIEKYKESIINL